MTDSNLKEIFAPASSLKEKAMDKIRLTNLILPGDPVEFALDGKTVRGTVRRTEVTFYPEYIVPGTDELDTTGRTWLSIIQDTEGDGGEESARVYFPATEVTPCRETAERDIRFYPPRSEVNLFVPEYLHGNRGPVRFVPCTVRLSESVRFIATEKRPGGAVYAQVLGPEGVGPGIPVIGRSRGRLVALGTPSPSFLSPDDYPVEELVPVSVPGRLNPAAGGTDEDAVVSATNGILDNIRLRMSRIAVDAVTAFRETAPAWFCNPDILPLMSPFIDAAAQYTDGSDYVWQEGRGFDDTCWHSHY